MKRHEEPSGRQSDCTLPHNLEAERSVLGAILIDNATFARAADLIDGSDFFRDAHRRTWAADVRLLERGEPVDLVTLKDELIKSGELAEVGGPAYIGALTDGVPRSANVEYYAKIVKEKATLRRLIQASNDLLVRAYDGEEDSVALLDGAARAIAQVASRSMLAPAAKDLFVGPDELAAESAQPTFIVPGLVVAGAITELSGGAKTAGKTTLLAAMVRPVLAGDKFIGHQTLKTPVVWLTEQAGSSFGEVIRRAGLTRYGRDQLSILSRARVGGRNWKAIVAMASRRCEEIGSSLLIVDTLPQFAGIRGDGENNAGDALEALEPLQELAAKGVAIVVVRHDRKGGGEVGQSARGSTAFTGGVDICLRLKRPEGRHPDTYRVLEGVGRFDGIPAHLVIEKVSAQVEISGIEVWADSFRAVGDVDAVATDSAKNSLERYLPDTSTAALTIEEIVHRTGSARSAIQRAISSLQGVETVGTGRKGNPKKFFLPKPQSYGLRTWAETQGGAR